MLAQQINIGITLKNERKAINSDLNRKLTDIDTIEQVLAGKKNAFKTLYSKYARHHFLTCLRYVKVKPVAEDLLQDAYLNIYKNLKQFNPERAKFSTWSNRVVINTCLMHLRKNDVFNKSDDINQVDAKSNNLVEQSKAIGQLGLKELTTLIQKLPKGYRTVFNLYVIDGYSHQEIANILNISISTSKTQLLKAKKALQNEILTNYNT